MIFAVHHRMGCSLFEARTEESALRKAEKAFGTHSGPYYCPEDQAQEIANAKYMGAGVLR